MAHNCSKNCKSAVLKKEVCCWAVRHGTFFSMQFRLFCAAFLASALLPSAHAIIISGTDPNSPVNSGSVYSGVVRVNLGGNGVCSGSLFGPSRIYVLTAAHCVAGVNAPYTNYNVAFDTPTVTTGLDPFAVVFIAPGYTGSGDFANDVAVIQLQNPAPADAASYSLYANQNEIGREVLLVGQGGSGTGNTGVDPNYAPSESRSGRRKGLNDFDQYAYLDQTHILYDFDNGTTAQNAFNSSLGRGIDEVTIAGGDSGGPSFDFATGLIIGVHSYNTCFTASASSNACVSPPDLHPTVNGPAGYFGEIGGDARVSIYTSNFLAPFIGTATPEPATWAMMGAGCLAVLGGTIRRRKG